MDFALFVLLNAVLFIRPAEIVPALVGLPIYNAVILGCIVASLGKILEQISTRSLAERPITVFVLGVWATVILSNLVRLDLAGSWSQGLEFSKVVVYYLLLNAVLDTPARFEKFLSWLVALVVVMSVLALLHQRGTIQIPGLELIERREYNQASGEEVGAEIQLMSTGIYNDPNDFCMVLVIGICLAAYRGLDPRGGIVRIIWIASAILFGYALILTRSRGGFIGLLAFVFMLLVARWGWRRAVVPALVLLPALLLLSGGRQTAISTGADTAQSRMLLWREGLIMLLPRPLTGIGAGRYGEDMIQVAHNSFVHAFVELGLVGGSCFLALFHQPFWSLCRPPTAAERGAGGDLVGFRPYLAALLAGYAAGMFSLSRCYIIPTYMVAGLAATYLRLVPSPSPSYNPRLQPSTVARAGLLGLAFLVFIWAFLRFSIQR